WETDVKDARVVLKERKRDLAREAEGEHGGKPVVRVDQSVDRVGEVLLSYIKAQEFYKREDTVCRIRPTWTKNDGYLETFDNASLESRLYSELDFEREVKGNIVIATLNEKVMNYIKHDPRGTLLPLKGIATTPIVTPQGKIITTPGYDAETQMFY